MVEHLTADWEVPSWTTVRVPCYYCHYLYGTHKDLSGPSIQTPSIYLFIYLAALVSWGWGQSGPKTTLPYIMFVKIICRCKKVLGCDRSCPERRSTSYTPTQTVCGKLVCYWYIYVPGTVYTQLQTYRQYISMCFKFIIFKLQVFIHIPCKYMYCLNCS